ncbi:glucosylceramidase [Hymenobacter jeollabukensis]|uniref:Glucosylceramidase n=2 Tax=Hymenobacter jeollabukensis TaxID=2025313 RepID=A0A5R8WXI8_9BACT|nr:glucosylceramidase [Hymenobacter jeollabukensis]
MFALNPKRLARLALSGLLLAAVACQEKDPQPNDPGTDPPVVQPSGPSQVAFWLTNGDRSALFRKQATRLNFAPLTNQNPTIVVDTTQQYQGIDGFGFTLTGGSAYVINRMSSTARAGLLRELFAADSTWLGVSYLRLSIGASDLSDRVFTYNDLPAGQTDEPMAQFSLQPERADLLPVLREILAINPNIKLLGTPWTAPSWMKTNGSPIGGSLKSQYYAAYARYFVKYVQQMQAEGVRLDAVTVQNEPLNQYNEPSMTMTAAQQAEFVRDYLGPAFQANNLTTKIIAYDHNADAAGLTYVNAVLGDAGARAYLDGSAFHLYENSNITNLSAIHNSFPQKNVYFTEQYVNSTGSFAADLNWHVNNLLIGAPRNWSRNVLEWNLAANAGNGPRTTGGCSTCLPAVTVTSDNVTRNQAYYIIAHASKFVRPGSVRIGSNTPSDLANVAYKTPAGKKVLIVLNTSSAPRTFNIDYRGKQIVSALNGGSVGTYVW